ncbi:MAG TPA: type II toxin-antitoxin system prevent-host-death family antitoxin [Planctomycetota bacterium]
MSTHTATLDEARSGLDKLLEIVAHGDEVVLTRDSQPVAKLVPAPAPSSTKKRELLGIWKGKIWMSPDFDDPLPELEGYVK